MIGWFLLAVLGERCGVAEASGVELPLFAFGVGALFLAIAYVSVFQAFSLPAAPTSRVSASSACVIFAAAPGATRANVARRPRKSFASGFTRRRCSCASTQARRMPGVYSK